MAKPLEMCKYCDVKNREFNLKWERSKKDISEWAFPVVVIVGIIVAVLFANISMKKLKTIEISKS